MSSYLDRHAELYDVFYADKPYAAEAAFVGELLSSLGAPAPADLLELACGTGRHARELERLGYSVVATDYSRDMLACARRRAADTGSKVTFHESDMRTLDLPGQTFDGAVCLFDSVGYLQTNQAILDALRAVRRHLRPDGALVLEFWHAAAMLRGYDPARVRRFRTPDGEVVRISETSLDCFRQLAHVSYEIIEIRDGAATRLRETQTNRYFLAQEMRALLDQAGFEDVRWCAGFSQAGAIDETTWHIVVAARRNGS
jgi:ubiquinone/menaquinone biosynthesis C-methylase UbiE